MVNLRPLLVTLVLLVVGWLAWSEAGRGADLEERAALAACRGKVCQAEFKKRHRTLFGWTFWFSTYGERARAMTVECSRPYWVAGDWDCAVTETNTMVDSRFKSD